MREKWKSITGYEGLYEISSQGRAKNARTNNILKPISNGNGYFQVEVRKNGKPKRCLVHRLVAQAFLDGFSDDVEINHKNGIKSDNRLCNIEIVTRFENMRHRVHELHIFGAVNTPKPVLCVETNTIYKSIREAARAVGTSQSNISHCLAGKTRTAAKFHWKYSENY